jgi:dipeptidase E
MNLLLLSNSTNANEEYLLYALPYMQQFLNKKAVTALFIPYAAVSISYDTYFNKVKDKLSTIGVQVQAIHKEKNATMAIENAEVIIVGGGNTFKLLKTLQTKNLLSTIRKKVCKGTPYIGWSAGSNIACQSISTTNDMPIVEPQNFKALGFIPFQINPHYTDSNMENHAGETREMRIEEYLIANPNTYVAGLREGTMFVVENNSIRMQGNKACRIFKKGHEPKELNAKNDFSFLLKASNETTKSELH